MSQHDYNIADQNGLSLQSDLNSVFAAILSNNSGAAEPDVKTAFMFWADTTAGILKQRNAANNAWIDKMSLSTGLMIGTDVQAYNANNALKSDIQSGSAVSAVASGTVDAITATFSPAPTLVDMMQFNVRALGANTISGVTFNPNSLGALTIYKEGGAALAVGDIKSAGHELILRYRASPARYELINAAAVIDATSPYAAIGWNQTWQDVTGTRAASTTYTNTTGKPIIFSYGAGSSGAGGTFVMTINGVSVAAPSWGSSVSSGIGVSYVIPDGHTYSYTDGGYTNSLKISELRL